MPSENFQPIPPDIIEAWAKGEYYVGDIPSISYRRLGIALFLRSWYTYQHVPEDKEKFAGVIKIDIKGAFLFMGGIRLTNSGNRTSVFWRSEASHFVSDDEVIWFYSVFNCDNDANAAIRSKYVPESWLTQTGNSSPEDKFGLTSGEWNTLLDKLRTDFDSDIEQIQKSCTREQIDEGMLRFNLIADQNDQHRSTYYQFYSAPGKERDLLKGDAFFTKAVKV